MSQEVTRTSVIDRAEPFLTSDHFSEAQQTLSNDQRSANNGLRGVQVQSTAKDGENPKSERNESERRFDEDWTAAYQARFASGRKHPFAMPHQTQRFPEDNWPSLMSWWPMPADPQYFQAPKETKVSIEKTGKKQESLFHKLEHRLGELIFGAGEHHHSSGKAKPKANEEVSESTNLFNVVLTVTHMQKDVNSTIQGVLVCGTYDSLPAAKSFAHQCLFDAGYEKEWFASLETQHEGVLANHKQNQIVKATGPSGEEFIVNISTIPNVFNLKSNDTGRIELPLYHVVQTTIHYRDDESGQNRDTNIQGSFKTFNEARKVALSTLLWAKDDISRETYAAYDEAGPSELDCGYGENVIVHAIGQNGENFIVSVLKGYAMGSKAL